MRRSTFLPFLALLALCVAAPATQADTLAGTAWVLSSAGKRAPAITFQPDGKVVGSGGCNRFFGGYEQNEEALTFSALGATRMACAPEVMKREQSFFDMLGAVRRARVDGSTLVMFDDADRELARFARRAPE